MKSILIAILLAAVPHTTPMNQVQRLGYAMQSNYEARQALDRGDLMAVKASMDKTALLLQDAIYTAATEKNVTIASAN